MADLPINTSLTVNSPMFVKIAVIPVGAVTTEQFNYYFNNICSLNVIELAELLIFCKKQGRKLQPKDIEWFFNK